MLSILIVDDYEPVRRGIRRLIETRPEWKVCGEAANGLEALRKIKDLGPQVVLMDVQMPGLDGLAATRKSIEAHPDAKIIVLTQHESAQVKQSAFNAGARGFVCKSQLPDVLVTAVAAVSRGECFFN